MKKILCTLLLGMLIYYSIQLMKTFLCVLHITMSLCIYEGTVQAKQFHIMYYTLYALSWCDMELPYTGYQLVSCDNNLFSRSIATFLSRFSKHFKSPMSISRKLFKVFTAPTKKIVTTAIMVSLCLHHSIKSMILANEMSHHQSCNNTVVDHTD